jgi:hypothetical protein
MPGYMVIRKRAYWVREVMHIDAGSPEQAADEFLDNFDPELVIEEVFRLGNQQFSEPTEVIATDQQEEV